ncbi:hypothetical protein JQ582_40800 [Bradyrhizobium japonicum]|uniref:hypothetical protein n=1 Tax=Bradyrhizobium japonicum TaxID=375 RepID=UPI001BAD00C7|nr:hypothetical protein [Bradyrhizobium japonicum]MBR0750259.1 hypothetical protein [Bradyrhizobium japonicum]
MMSQEELRALGEDIRKNGLREGVSLIEGKLLDGRNRLDAMELVGFKLVTGNGQPEWANIPSRNVQGVDPVSFVISKNVHRRHLTADQKRELIEKLVKATPEKSNRQIAEIARVSHVTVGTVRAKLKSTGQIDQLTKTVGKDGRARKQPTQQPTVTKQKDPAIAAAADRAVARSEQSQRTQAPMSASTTAACAAQEPKATVVSERFSDFALMIEEECERLPGKQRADFLLYLRAVMDRLLTDASADAECAP